MTMIVDASWERRKDLKLNRKGVEKVSLTDFFGDAIDKILLINISYILPVAL